MPMTSRERVAAALRCQTPDRLPWCEIGVDPYLVTELLGWGPENQAFSIEGQPYTLDQAQAIADFLGLDNLYYVVRAPVFAEKTAGKDGRLFYGAGQIRARADLAQLELPDPADPAVWDAAARFLDGRGDYSTWLVTRAGIFPTMLGMGTEAFSIALYDDRALVEEILDRYVAWACVVAEQATRLGFDAIVTTDDMAFGTTTFFSPHVFRDLCMPRYRALERHIGIPWIIHSDGNMLPFMDDLLTLKIAAFHPWERAAMDIRDAKRRFGGRLCLIGNVDLNTLGMGTPQEVTDEVRGLIRDVAPGGGYIISSGNSLAGYLRPENVLAMRDVLRSDGTYPIHDSANRVQFPVQVA